MRVFVEYKGSLAMWKSFEEFAIKGDFTDKKHLLQILQLYHEGERLKTKVLGHFVDKYLMGRGLLWNLSQNELIEVETYYNRDEKKFANFLDSLRKVQS